MKTVVRFTQFFLVQQTERELSLHGEQKALVTSWVFFCNPLQYLTVLAIDFSAMGGVKAVQEIPGQRTVILGKLRSAPGPVQRIVSDQLVNLEWDFDACPNPELILIEGVDPANN